MKQIEVTILGQSYRLTCPEDGEASLREAVTTVDQEMSGIRDAGRVKARERIAVLAALNLAYRLADQAANATVNGSGANGVVDGAHDAASRGASQGDDVVANATINRLVARIDGVLGEDGLLI